MNRMKLGLFGTARATDERIIVGAVEANFADKQERLAGLTPVEAAAVEAMSQSNETSLATR